MGNCFESYNPTCPPCMKRPPPEYAPGCTMHIFLKPKFSDHNYFDIAGDISSKTILKLHNIFIKNG